ncbi:MAG TPA: hypothetical protein VFP65_29600 [Anaeromyxobacteraceae bacterium]|nr:hypothetical protein [Anaeromyxobacteraceae bacterium]
MSVVSEVLRKVHSPELRVSLVWVPALRWDDLEEASRVAADVRDARVSQYWDEGGRLAHALGGVLSIPAREGVADGAPFAWDVYLLYPPGPVFGDRPPAPAQWLHQLSHLPEGRATWLDAAALEERLRALTGAEGEAR